MLFEEKNTEKYGVENLKKSYTVAAGIGEGIYTIVDGGTNVGELAAVGGNVILKSMGNIPDLKMIPKEYADMSDAEREEINAHFAKEFDIPNDKVEGIIEKAQTWLNASMDLGFSIFQARK